MEDRQKQVVSSLKVFNDKRSEEKTLENRMLAGISSLEEIADQSDEEGSS